MQREVRLKETGYRCSTPASTPAHMIAPSIKALAFGTVFGELKSSKSNVFLYILKNNMLFFFKIKNIYLHSHNGCRLFPLAGVRLLSLHCLQVKDELAAAIDGAAPTELVGEFIEETFVTGEKMFVKYHM